jgi:hypothetical protein
VGEPREPPHQPALQPVHRAQADLDRRRGRDLAALAAAVQKGISLVYQYWIHTETIRRLPAWFEAVFNTPSHHRVHHARNPVYLDRNYAGILIVWDKLFGTFQPELDAEPCRYGVVRNLATFNLLRVAFHEWIAIARDLVRQPRHAVRWLFGPPGWSPDGSRETSAMIKARAGDAHRQMDQAA